MKEPTTPYESGREIVFANSMQSLVRSLSTSPEMHIASVWGLISFLINSFIEALTAIGGGGGVGGGNTELPVEPLGGGLPWEQNTRVISMHLEGSKVGELFVVFGVCARECKGFDNAKRTERQIHFRRRWSPRPLLYSSPFLRT